MLGASYSSNPSLLSAPNSSDEPKATLCDWMLRKVRSIFEQVRLLRQLQDPDPEKSMILSQFASRLSGRGPTPRAHTPASRARGWGGKMAQKGDFSVAWSIAIASFNKISISSRISRELMSYAEGLGIKSLFSL